MKRKLVVLALCLALLCAPALAGMLACACAEEAEPRRGAYIQWDENGYTAVYAPDGTLLYPAGRYEARREEDQLIHLVSDLGEGLLTDDGRMLSDPAEDMDVSVSPAGDVHAWDGEKETVWDASGAKVLELECGWMSFFQGDYAVFDASFGPDEREGIVDRRGNILAAPEWESIGDSEDSGLEQGVTFAQRGDEVFLIDVHGHTLTQEPLTADGAYSRVLLGYGFSEGVAAVEFAGAGTLHPWGYVDMAGRAVIPARFDSAGDFHARRAPVRLDSRWLIIDPQGETLCDLGGNYDSAEVTPSGCVIATQSAGRPGSHVYGRRSWLFRLDDDGLKDLAGGPCSQIWEISPEETGGAVRFIVNDMEGETPRKGDKGVESANWQSLPGLVTRRGGYVLLDQDGRALCEPVQDADLVFYDGLMRVRIDGRYGFMDVDGQMVIPAEYDETTEFWNGRAILGRAEGGGRRWFLADAAGRLTEVQADARAIDFALDNLAEYYGCAKGYEHDLF